jgi:hypothetical protein
MVYQKHISIDISSTQLPAAEHNTIAGKEGLRHVLVNCRQLRQ